ncbi:MAG TPA: RNA polymerase sigma factor, partial [Thiohalobacter sp.]|nr:RNA polymerase sigma factor [Thiohalobacter sp.]
TRAYEIIMRKYNQRLYRIARSILKNESEAEDAVQDAYVRAYYNLKRYNPTGRFGAWLGRIAVNEALMRRRKSKTDRFDEFKTVDDVAGNNLTALAGQRDPSEEAAGEELVKLVEDAIDSLPTDFRVVFVMRSIEQMSTSETAEALDIKAATVKTRHFRARQLIQSRLERKISLAELRSYEFAGERCDRIVARVYAALGHER